MKRCGSPCCLPVPVVVAGVLQERPTSPLRAVAITIDDLPAASNSMSAATIHEMTRQVAGHAARSRVPVVGFVAMRRGSTGFGEVDEAHQGRSRCGSIYGFELGNHTFSQPP